MKKIQKFTILTLFYSIGLILFVLGGCSSTATTEKIVADSTIKVTQCEIHSNDTSQIQKEELVKIYTRAITDYIKAVYKRNKTVFDTLYFGKRKFGQPDDFPDIELPKTIENTEIKLIDFDLAAKMQKEKKSLVYINMMGWVDKKKAEFILVTFSNGGEHKLDCYIDYMYNTSINDFDLEKIRIEDQF